MLGGGSDILIGGDDGSENELFGDSGQLSGKAEGGNDTLIGGDNNPNADHSLLNTLIGDATDMFGFAKGGDDVITGGDVNVLVFGETNLIFGDAETMSGKALGGNDTLAGGNSLIVGSQVGNKIVGDAHEMSDTAKGGDDVLIAGIGPSALFEFAVQNFMIGDAEVMSGLAKGGADTFVFHDNGSMTVGTHNSILDFSQSQHDKIQFISVVGAAAFADLTFDTTTQPGSTIIHAGDDAVTLIGFTGTLTEHDFLFG